MDAGGKPAVDARAAPFPMTKRPLGRLGLTLAYETGAAFNPVARTHMDGGETLLRHDPGFVAPCAAQTKTPRADVGDAGRVRERGPSIQRVARLWR
jgi:hypothetical protein